MLPSMTVLSLLLLFVMAAPLAAAFDFSLVDNEEGNEYHPAYMAKTTAARPRMQHYRDMLNRAQGAIRRTYTNNGRSYADFVSNPLWQQSVPDASQSSPDIRCPTFLVGRVEGC
uniref:Uncharacterized protein n=1 Tax=Plectus sambesii TaxID=2011161 RepID=A0A914V3F5_9BILA